jgi:hypothetical protein
MTSADTVWAGGTFRDPSGRIVLTVLNAGSRRGWLYFDGEPLESCAPPPCDAPLDRGADTAEAAFRLGRRYWDAATGLSFRCLRPASGALRFGADPLSPVEVVQTRTLPLRRRWREGSAARDNHPIGACHRFG